jgi:stearoyl-CoA desaturase (Delta-9 desaturase)
MHHAFSDTEKDPHSPIFFRDVFGMMWHTKKIYLGLVNGTFKVEDKFYKNYPISKTIDKMGDSWISRIIFITGYVLFYVEFATHWWMYLLLPFHFLMGPVHGAIVNWAGHKYGYRNYNEKDHSKNSLPFDFITGGELFQNNHHRYGARPNFATKWWEIDPTYPIIKLLNAVGVIKLVRTTT